MAEINANALSLVDFAQFSNDPKIESVAWALVKHNAVMQDIPWFNQNTLTAAGARWEDGLPGTNWVKLNEPGVTVDGKPRQFMEQAYISRNTIETDHLLTTDANAIVDPHINRLDAYLRGRSYVMNDIFINNDHVNGDDDAPVGLSARLDNPVTYRIKSDNKMNFGSTLTTAATASNLVAHFEKLDEMLDNVDSPDGNGVVIYANGKYLRRLSALSKIHAGSGGFSVAKDQYDRDVVRYKGAILRDIGRKIDQSTPIITSTEANTGAAGNSTYTSIYAVNYSPMNFAGWIRSMQAKDIVDPNGVLRKTFIELVLGFFPQTHRCFARGYNINLG